MSKESDLRQQLDEAREELRALGLVYRMLAGDIHAVEAREMHLINDLSELAPSDTHAQQLLQQATERHFSAGKRFIGDWEEPDGTVFCVRRDGIVLARGRDQLFSVAENLTDPQQERVKQFQAEAQA